METRQLYLTAGHPNRPGTKITVTGVVVHWTANEAKGADAEANRNYFNRAYKKISGEEYESDGKTAFRFASAHLNVDDKELIECLPWKKGQAEMGYHVGASSYISGITTKLKNSYPNAATIGLEICVNADGDFSKAYANGIKVIAMMLKEHGLGIDALYRHYDVTGKACPGFFTTEAYAQKYLKTTAASAWASFKTAVSKELAGGTTTTTTPSTANYYKVYIDGVLYKYQFATVDGAINCAKDLFVQSGGTNSTIKATNPDGSAVYTPALHLEDFPQFKNKFTVVNDRYLSTDIKLLKLPKGNYKMQLVWEKGAKVSTLVKKYGAKYGINFPFFWDGSPVADTKIGTKAIQSVTTGKTTKWSGLKYKDGVASIGKVALTDDVGANGFLLKSTPVLVEGGKNVQAAYVKNDETAADIATSKCQRTALGFDKDGNVFIVVTDGREGADNVGLGLNDLAEYLVSKGIVTALNGDGGGSSVLADQSGVLIGNVGSAERAVNHALLIFEESDTVSTPTTPSTSIPTTPSTGASPVYRIMLDGKQQGAYSVMANAETQAKTLYRQTKSANLFVTQDGTTIYTPSKHPEDFPDLIVDGLSEDTQKAVLEYLKKKFG